MKKLITTLVLGLSMGTSALAQGISFRLGADALFPKQPMVEDLVKRNVGLSFGAALEFNFLHFLYVAPGVNYHMGTTALNSGLSKVLDVNLPESDKNYSVSDHSLIVPVNLGFRFKPLGLIGVSAEAGPYLNYRLRRSWIDANNKEVNVNQLTQDLKDLNKDNMTYGLNASAAVEFSLLYIRGGVYYPLSKNSLDFSTLSKGAENLVNELKNQGMKSNNLQYFVGVGLRF